MRALRTMAIMAFLAGALAACEGVMTGTEVARVPLQAAEGGPAGAYAPVKLELGPDMNPVAINFRADFTQDPAESGKWNTYRAALSRGGNVIVARTLNVNHPAAGPDNSAPPPTTAVNTLFIVDVQSSGEYELTLTPVSPVAIVLNNAQVDVRRNVQRPPQ